MLRTVKCLALMALILIPALVLGQSDVDHQSNEEVRSLPKVKPLYPVATFTILSDIHYYDSSLGASGSAFQNYLDNDRKLLVESGEILSAAIDKIMRIPADFTIIVGDLTKDGERINHQTVAVKLRRMIDAGKKVFVVPGNHDVRNGDSMSFQGDQTLPVPNVSAAEFAEIYDDYGYEAAIERDPDSLSYLAEPVPGLWLLALDSCRWKENKPEHHPLTAGGFSEQTRKWIENALIRSIREKKAVIAMMHHGVVEHYPANKKHYAQYLVEDFEAVGKMMASFGVRLVFTGHFHAQDVTRKLFDDPKSFIFDIETGSLVTAPCPYRIVRISSDQKAVIRSGFIESISSHPTDFRDFADQFVFEGTIRQADTALKKYWVSEKDRKLINSQISKAYMTHLLGDEQKPAIVVDKTNVGIWGRLILFLQGDLIDGWYTDLPPADNRLIIDLTDGSFENQ